MTIERGRIKHKMRRALDRELAWPGQLGEEYETRVKNKIIEKYGEQYWKDINKSKKQRQWEKKARLDGLLVKEEVELDYVNEMQEEFNRMTMQNMRRDVRGTMVELTNINEPKIRVKILDKCMMPRKPRRGGGLGRTSQHAKEMRRLRQEEELGG